MHLPFLKYVLSSNDVTANNVVTVNKDFYVTAYKDVTVTEYLDVTVYNNVTVNSKCDVTLYNDVTATVLKRVRNQANRIIREI